MGIQHVELVYEQGGNAVNEDAYVAEMKNKVFSVIDGATGLSGLSGKLAAEIVMDSLRNMNANESLLQSIIQASSRLDAAVSAKMGVDHVHLLPKEDRSTCGFAAIQIVDGQMEYAHAGDCMIFLQYENKEIRILTHDHLSQLDATAIKLVSEKWEMKTHNEDPNSWVPERIQSVLQEIRREIMPTLIENRRKMNTANGYGIIDGSKESIGFLEIGCVPLVHVDKILLLSDGLQLPDQKSFGQKVWLDTAEYAFTHGLEQLKDEVNRLESSDKACYRYPRLKYADDKTGILVQL